MNQNHTQNSSIKIYMLEHQANWYLKRSESETIVRNIYEII